MQLYIRGNKLFTLKAQKDDNVKAIKEKIFESQGVEISSQILSYHGKPLYDNLSLENYNMSDNSTLDFSIKILGGKVHGSLARAGKVKGQTPKVEKQEKKKAKTGRAKRRIQYNRRFVNVVADGRMKKKGPNSNS
ncbi:unnamed protein product [Gordionus sp. m RMFG-2023]|uniref:ubiquitin-like FUBI-ribosomal protein eS30 fusion protein n=1 Tax=Gordionus sp. m RMFG-2023 TaxID=3053472 RepID=UPI0030DF227C